MDTQANCCPKFDPSQWDGKELVWSDKLFVKDRVFSMLHMPLNFGAVVTRNMGKISRAGAQNPENLMIADENSLWGADVYIAVDRPVAHADMAKLSGTFLAKVFEGQYKDMGNWINQMNEFVKSRGKTSKKLFFYYTTCPKCAKVYGKNFVVIFAQV